MIVSSHNSLHLLKMSDKHYQCEHGYFMFKSDKWIFIPFEKEFNESFLGDIVDTLHRLNTLRHNHD